MHKTAKEIMDRVKTKINTCGVDGITEPELLEMEHWTSVANNMTAYDYHYKIIEEMEKPEAKFYTEGGRYYTPTRGGNGNVMGYEQPEMMHRDMDMNRGRMYYTEPGSMDMGESKYDRAKKGYEASKSMNPSTDNMRQIEELLNTFEEDINKLKAKMTVNEKSYARNKFSNMSNSMM